ncbi:uncharacterized protein V1513DRAFT_155612 [Lipomyces chichibuensis]|uniref:uncharacterized protein n=1 Tax=Lipomyces chichibuensis TaxID=1546026 RepID=UPI00334421F7
MMNTPPPTTVAPLQSSCVSCFKESPAYKCPTCLARYCSVACFSTHKTRSGCRGMRDVKDTVMRYIPRTDLIGQQGYNYAAGSGAVGSSGYVGEDKEETMKAQRLRDRDYNFLSLIERRIGVRRNIAQDALRRGSRRARGRGGGRGRRAGRANRSHRGGGVAEPSEKHVEDSRKLKEDSSGNSDDSHSDSDSDSSNDASDESGSDEAPAEEVSSKPPALLSDTEVSDNDAPPEEASSKIATAIVEDASALSTAADAHATGDN